MMAPGRSGWGIPWHPNVSQHKLWEPMLEGCFRTLLKLNNWSFSCVTQLCHCKYTCHSNSIDEIGDGTEIRFMAFIWYWNSDPAVYLNAPGHSHSFLWNPGIQLRNLDNGNKTANPPLLNFPRSCMCARAGFLNVFIHWTAAHSPPIRNITRIGND